jgi:hypothetical protein
MRIAESVEWTYRGEFMSDLATAIGMTRTADVVGMALLLRRTFEAKAQAAECCQPGMRVEELQLAGASASIASILPLNRRASTLTCTRKLARAATHCAPSEPSARHDHVHVTCELCHHEAVMNVDAFDDAIQVSAFGPRMVCTVCGIIGAYARPNWKERSEQQSLAGVHCR